MEAKNIYQKLFEVKKSGIKLQRDTNAFNYKYATLSQIQEKLGEELQKQGLLVIHRIENNLVVTEIINPDSKTDESGIIQSSISLTEGIKPQDKGSEITYYRRYNLLSLLDLEVEDDDGKKAQDSKPIIKKAEKWYNDTGKNIDKWTDMVSDGETTGKAILNKITVENGYKIKNADKELILNLDNK